MSWAPKKLRCTIWGKRKRPDRGPDSTREANERSLPSAWAR